MQNTRIPLANQLVVQVSADDELVLEKLRSHVIAVIKTNSKMLVEGKQIGLALSKEQRRVAETLMSELRSAGYKTECKYFAGDGRIDDGNQILISIDNSN